MAAEGGEVFYLEGFQNSLILTLEDVLRKARAGEISGLFIAGTLKNSDVISCGIVDDDASVFELVGCVESSKADFIRSHIEPRQGRHEDRWGG